MPPKVRALSDLIEKYESPLTADFQRVYGLRLSQAVQERDEDEILDLITWLPAGAALHAYQESNGDLKKALKLYGWDTSNELGLAMVNLVRHQTYVIQQVQSPKKIPVPQMTLGPRPAKKKVPASLDANGIAHGFLQAAKAAKKG